MEQLFEKDFRKGGTSDFLTAFTEVFTIIHSSDKKYSGPEAHPIYAELKKLADQKKFLDIMTHKRMNMKEELSARRKKRCDEVFAEYLAFVAEHAKESYYK